MENYKLAEVLGKGAFATVYKAFNWDTGQTTAVKQISLENIAQADLPDIMGEIHLLKNLNHPNIVQYRGFVKTVDHLHIILEYCENGSLHTVMKKFGCFPEPLVALYALQILNGLKYLHEQGVIHRDIKASNILLDKTGAVRLADFGVSTRVAPSLALSTNSPESAQGDNSVAGSPYWMSPEVISQQISTPASDIWSLGIVIIELLTSKPPYSNLAPLPALFKIVNEDSPPIPGKLSEGGKEFLVECFQKDWRLRVGAKRLLKHSWIAEARGRMERKEMGAEKATSGGFDDDVLRVREWNQALNRSPKISFDDSTMQAQQKQKSRRQRILRRPSSELASVLQSDHKLPLLATIAAKGQALPAVVNTIAPVANGIVAVSVSLGIAGEAGEGEDDNWDVDFEEGIPISKIIALDRETSSSNSTSQSASETESADESDGGEEEMNSRTIRPSNPSSPTISPRATFGSRPGFASNASRNELESLHLTIRNDGGDVEDYSDLVGEDDEDPFRGKVDSLRLYNLSAKRILHPKDLSDSYLVNSPLSSPQLPSPLLPIKPSLLDAPRSVSSSKTPAGKENAIEKFSEVGNEDDYSDLFVKPVADGTGDGMRGLRLPVRLASKTWLGDDDSDEEDPFSNLEAPPPSKSGTSTSILPRTKLTVSPASTVRSTGSGSGSRKMNTLEMNLRRDRLSQSSLRVTELLETIASFSNASRTSRNAAGGSEGRKGRALDKELLRDSSLHLLEILEESPEIKSHFLTLHGLLTILQILKAVDRSLFLSKEKEREVLAILLRLFNLIIDGDLVLLEKICLIGACPVVTRFVSDKFSREIRLEAALFIGAMSRSSVLTLQMFIACDGLSILVGMLDENYEQGKDIIWLGVDCISRVFELQGPTPRNDFCRLFLASGLLEPLSAALTSVCSDEDDLAESAKAKIVQIFCIFSQSDRNVKIGLGSRTIALRLVKALKMLSVELLLPLLKTIKYLTMAPETLDILQEARIIETLVQILAVNLDQNRLCAEIVISLFNLSRLSKSRQTELAQVPSAIPILITLVSTDSPLKQFALPILCDFAQAGSKSRAVLGREGGMEVYLDVLGDPFWSGAALEAILAWLQDESASIEEKLLQPSAIEAILKVFIKSRTATLDSILETYHKILRISTSLTIRLASHPSFFKRIVDQLARGGKAVTRLNLLKILKSSLEALGTTKNNRLAGGFQNYDQLVKVVGGIAEADQAILVRQLAKELGKELGGYLGSNGSGRGTLIGLGKRRSLRKKSTDASGRLVSGGESKRNSGEVRKVSSIQAKKRSDD